jgi:hypothetical protein
MYRTCEVAALYIMTSISGFVARAARTGLTWILTCPSTDTDDTENEYRHEQMIRAREQREVRRAERQKAVRAALWSSLTVEDRRLWLVFSGAVERVPPISG